MGTTDDAGLGPRIEAFRDALRALATTESGFADERLGVLVCEEALGGLAEGNYGVGCLMLDPTGAVVARGHNQVFRPRFRSDRHSEMVVLDRFEADHDTSDLGRHVVFCSLEPCPMCLSRLIITGVGTVKFVAPDDGGGMVRHLGALPANFQRLARPLRFVTADCSPALRSLALDIFTSNLADLQAELRRRSASAPARPEAGAREDLPQPKSQSPAPGPPPIKSVLFADVAGFSRIPEDSLPRFLEQYAGFLSEAFASPAGRRAVSTNTWGDGLYAVFGGVADAAEFALALLERAADGSVDWAGFGLGEGAPLRVALHTGPVFEAPDLAGRPAYSGPHVTRAARIVPATARGRAYASEPFAARLAAEAPTRFGREFVGVETLPDDDRCPLYHVTRA